jgi:hypothetical protein
MSSRLLRRILTAVVLIAALALPLSAQVAAVQRPSAGVAGPAFLEDLADAFRHWLAHLWAGTLEKNGAQIDPNGGTTPAGTAGVGGDNGPIIDPDG